MMMMIRITSDPPVNRLSSPAFPSSSHAAKNVSNGKNIAHVRFTTVLTSG